MSYIANAAVRISKWLDSQDHPDMSAMEWTMHRVLKVSEEAGEVYNAFHNWRGGNPRKMGTKTEQDVIDELLDTAAAALCAVEHLTGNAGRCTTLLETRMSYTVERAGLNG